MGIVDLVECDYFSEVGALAKQLVEMGQDDLAVDRAIRQNDERTGLPLVLMSEDVEAIRAEIVKIDALLNYANLEIPPAAKVA